MKTGYKILGLVLLFGGGAYVISQLKRISVTLLNIDPPKIKSGALVLAVNVGIDNPTGIPIVLTKPTLVAFINGKEAGNSIPSTETIKINAHERSIIKGINIQIPFTNVGAFGLSLVNGKLSNVGIDVELHTTADGLPISSKKHFNL